MVKDYVVAQGGTGDGTALGIKCITWTKGIRQRRGHTVMMVSLDTHLYLTLTMMFSAFSALSSSPNSSSCELQAQFNNLNRMYKAGDFVIGALFEFHLSSDFPEMSYTSKRPDPTCYG